MPYEFTVHELPEQPVLSIRSSVPASDIPKFFGRAFADLYGHVGLLGLAPTGHPFVLYHAFGDAIDMEVCVPIAREVSATGRIRSRTLEPVTVARTLHAGPYDELGVAYEALNHWIGEHDFEAAGPPRERYLNGPDTVKDPEGYRTEIEMPIVSRLVPAIV